MNAYIFILPYFKGSLGIHKFIHMYNIQWQAQQNLYLIAQNGWLQPCYFVLAPAPVQSSVVVEPSTVSKIEVEQDY